MSERWVTKQTLIQRIKEADPEDKNAWDDFVNYYKSFIEMLLTKSRFSQSETDDLVQEILLKIWKGIPQYEYRKGQAKFRTWLGCLITNSMYNYVDKLNRRHPNKLELKEAILLPESESKIEKFIEKEWVSHLTKMAMKEVMEIFSGHAIEVFKLSMEGKETNEISQILDITEDSVYVLRSRVKSRLKKEIKKLRDELEH